MALVPDQKFSTFAAGGTPTTGDIIVGLRGGINTKFNWVLPAGLDSITGTANQVLVNGSSGVPVTGNATLSTPQDIATTSSPTFNNLTLSGGAIFDANGNIELFMSPTISAVNFIAIANNIAGQVPSISAAGSDTNIGLLLQGKGTGGIGFRTGNTTVPFNFYSGTAAQHVTNFVMANTAANRTATWQDSDGTVAWLSDVMGTVTSITGTANQVLANGTSGSPETGAITLTLPQDIATTSNVTFGTVKFSSITSVTETPMLYDSYGNVLLAAKSAGVGAVNYLSIINNGTNNPVGISALGSDTDIGLAFGPKGAGSVGINTASPTNPLIIYNGTGSQHQTNFLFANTANSCNVTFQDASGTLAFLSDIPAGTPSALTRTNDTNVTVTLGGTPATALLQAVSLTMGWTGQLALTRGGTNASLTASNGGIVYSTASALAILAGTATAGQMLQSGSSAAPAWSTTTYPATNAINTIMYASSANVMGSIAAANSSVLVSSAGGVPSMSTTLPNINIGTPTAGVLTNTTGGGGLRSFQVFTSGTAATYTKPANVTSILVEMVGGGGGGGGITAGATTIAVSGGGGGGGYCRHFIASAAGTYTYTVGGGGAGGVGASVGTTGTATTFSTLTANGGAGGTVGTAAAASAAFVAPGGAGGTATGGNVANIQGYAGGSGFISLTSTQAGQGGASQFSGISATQTATTANGVAGQLYGGGGGGALGGLSGGTTQNGGAGAAGIIIVWEFS